MSSDQPIEHVIIAFDVKGAAFCHPVTQEPDDEWASREAAVIVTRILTKLVDRGLGDLHDEPILDSNGNTVGIITLTRAES